MTRRPPSNELDVAASATPDAAPPPAGPPRALPEPERREWLLDALRTLLHRTDWEHFVCSPIVLPRSAYFPDRWTPTTGGATRLIRRLLAYADLDDLTPHVDLFDNERPPQPHGTTHSVHHQGAAGLFLGIADGVAYFGADAELLADPGGITAALAHEVAHAYRTHHALCVDAIDEEEPLTDLTAVFLGFGILNANAALRHRSGFGADGIFSHRWSVQQLGYLPPQELCFLLAVQVFVRGADRATAKIVAEHLEPNQASYFHAALRWLERERPALAHDLGLPPPGAWPPPDDLTRLTRALPDDPADDPEPPPPAAVPAPRFNAGRPVFRVWRRRRQETFLVDFVLVLFGLLTLALATTLPVEIAAAAVAVLGPVLTVRRLRPRCSDPACDGLPPPPGGLCPRCGGSVSGELLYAQDRLAAEEALRTGRPVRLDAPP
jgi:hypothetical protein